MIEAKILFVSAYGQVVFIPRIPMTTNEYAFEYMSQISYKTLICHDHQLDTRIDTEGHRS